MTVSTIIEPATGRPFAEVPRTSAAEVDRAVARAVLAQRSWAAETPASRAGALRRFARRVAVHVEELAALEVRNSGHPIASARGEARHVAQVLEYYAGAPERLSGRQIPVAGGVDITYHEPYGVVGVIVPWNFPMTIASWGFAPALAAGNAVVLKPAELTPLTAIRLGELALEAGIPEDLFQVLPGQGSVVGDRFVTHPDVRMVVFTGSTEVGAAVAEGCARMLKPVTLELGGKSANIVFADADLERAAATVPASVFDNAGQDCCARSRILVQRSVHDRFLELLEPAVASWRVGDPAAEDTEMGPLISAAHRERVAGFLDGCDIALRGTAPGGDGFWLPPAVVRARPADRIAQEEVFGPVVAVIPFEDEADAIDLANGTVYGLAGSIWTENLGRALRVSRAVASGTLSVNSHASVRYATPFGGMKASGLGRELGPDAAEHFTQTKNVFYASGQP